jgi:hypothetical protein
MARLQAEATQKLATLQSQGNPPATGGRVEDLAPSSQPDPSTLSDRTMVEEDRSRAVPGSIGRYHCISGKHYGNLFLSTDGVSFETALSANERWTVRYKDMQGMQKARESIHFPVLSHLRPLNSDHLPPESQNPFCQICTAATVV